MLGPQQRVDEVDQKRRGHESGEGIVEDHGPKPPLQAVAGEGVRDRHGEEDKAERDHDDVHHLHAPGGRNGGYRPSRLVMRQFDKLTLTVRRGAAYGA